MSKEDKRLHFDELQDPFNMESPNISEESILSVIKDPLALQEMNLKQKLQFVAETARLMTTSPDFRNQVIDILKARSQDSID